MKLRHDILRFPQGKTKAFTMSYDDGVIQDRRLIALMREYGVKGTFNLNSGAFGQRDQYAHLRVQHEKLLETQLAEVYEGMEIATHTVHHPDLTRLPSGTALYELLEDRKRLEQLTGTLVRGHAYPFGAYSPQVMDELKAAGLIYARTVKSTHQFRLPDQLLEWHPTCHHDDPQLMTLAEEFLADKPTGRLPTKLFYVWGHAYEFDNNQNWSVMENLLKTVGGQAQVWYATNLEIAEYLLAASQLCYSADGMVIYNPTCQPVWINILDRDYLIPSGGTTRLHAEEGYLV